MKMALAIICMTCVAHADDPKAPANLHFADVCKYSLDDGKLSCRDHAGNLLVKNVRLYTLHLREPYDDLAVVSLLRREGFDLGARVDLDDKKTFLYFQKNGCGR